MHAAAASDARPREMGVTGGGGDDDGLMVCERGRGKSDCEPEALESSAGMDSLPPKERRNHLVTRRYRIAVYLIAEEIEPNSCNRIV